MCNSDAKTCLISQAVVNIVKKWKCHHSVVSNSLQPHGLGLSSLFCPWNCPDTGVDCDFLLQWSNTGIKHRSPALQADTIFWATKEALNKALSKSNIKLHTFCQTCKKQCLSVLISRQSCLTLFPLNFISRVIFSIFLESHPYLPYFS